MPLPISVVVPVFNGKKYVLDTIQSILNQSKPPHEIIIVDDGSTDESSKLLEHLPVRIITQKNRGISGARNTGILAASSEWIALCDQDDIWVSDKLEKQWSTLKKLSNVDLIFCDTLFLECGNTKSSEFNINQLVEATSISEPLPDVYRLDSSKLCNFMKSGNIITPSTLMVKKNLLISTLFDETLMRAEDRDIFLRMFPMANIAILNKPLVLYRIHENNHSLDCYKMQAGSAALALKIINNPKLFSKCSYEYMVSNGYQIFYNTANSALFHGDYKAAAEYFAISMSKKLSIKVCLKFFYAYWKKSGISD